MPFTPGAQASASAPRSAFGMERMTLVLSRHRGIDPTLTGWGSCGAVRIDYPCVVCLISARLGRL
jgi:hypothetical protein